MHLIDHKSQFFYGEIHFPDIHLIPVLPSNSTVVCHYLGNKLYCLAVAMRVISVAFLYRTENIVCLATALPKLCLINVCKSACMQSFVRSLHGMREYQNRVCLLQQECDVHQQICTSKSAAYNQPTEDFKAKVYPLWQHTESTAFPLKSRLNTKKQTGLQSDNNAVASKVGGCSCKPKTS